MTRLRASSSVAGANHQVTVDAAWLNESALIVVLSGGDREVDQVTASASTEGKQFDEYCLPIRGERTSASSVSAIVVLQARGDEVSSALPGLDIRFDRTAVHVPPSELAGTITDLSLLVRDALAGLDAETRTELLPFLASALSPRLIAGGWEQHAKQLFLIREMLRERLPGSIVSREEPQGMTIERIMTVDDTSFWVAGWIWDQDAALRRDGSSRLSQGATGPSGGEPPMRLTFVSPEGSRVEILEDAFRFFRRDVDEFYRGLADEWPFESGFVSYLRLPAPSRLTTGWVAEFSTAAGAACEAVGPKVVRGLETVRTAILENLAVIPRHSDKLMLDHVHPAISRIQEQLRGTVEAEALQWGSPPVDPRVSVIIPLYKRVDFMEHQLAQFAHDSTIKRADLIYVLDSPEQEDDLVDMAAALYELYGVPFRLLVLNRNAGFSQANNMGAAQARSPLLLLLNSDVLPDRPGWLDAMADFYESTPDIGALGPKLLFEDESLQHAGMYFEDISGGPEGVYYIRDMQRSVWQNAHYYKGLPRDLPAANVARAVPAVTGACMMVTRELYEELGGLSDLYVQGGYEDSDFCIRLAEKGRSNWYLPDVELYHLEAQSYSSTELRAPATKYNTWLQTHLWGDRIERLMRQVEQS